MGEVLFEQLAEADLRPYVPRLVTEWLRDEPGARWRRVDGTLAFVDISGFTAMSERLAGRGKAGAEEVTGVMNSTFSRLLTLAYAEGGSLLKLGGDALLLFYEGDAHAARAAKAAFGLRRELRAIGKPQTSAGRVALKLHVGMHSGPFDFFLVGGAHRELLVTGPETTKTVYMESASEAGDILLSPPTAALLEGRVLGPEKGGGILLRAEPRAAGSFEPMPDADGLDLAQAVPVSVRRHALARTHESEHRSAAIAFVRFQGVDRLLLQHGGEAVADAVDALVRIIQDAAAAHAVTFLESDVDLDGGRIVLVAGAPETEGDDEERLLRTLRAVVEAGPPLPVHVGANRGRVFAGLVGTPFRRTYTVLGDTAALAARLMARAPANEVWASAAVIERARSRFALDELAPFHVKGKSEAVRAYVVGRVEGARAAAPSPVLPMVDRQRERALLGASIGTVRAGFGSFVELVGDPGIGKSRLLEEVEEQCGDMRSVAAKCEQYESSTPYFPFRDFLRSLLDVELNGSAAENTRRLGERVGALAPELLEWLPLVAIPLDVEVEPTAAVDELEPSFRRARLHGVVGSLLERLLPEPALLRFEDVHWMDEASSDLLRHVGTQVATRPWLACATRRPVAGGFSAAEGVPPVPAITLRLDPLPAEDALELAAAAAAGRQLHDHELAAITERAGGNPLFLQELIAAGEPAEATDELPESVEAVVTARIDRLAPPDRSLLRWAAVLGPSFAGAVIANVLEGDPSAAADSEAWDRLAEFVERDTNTAGGFRFRHALIRDAAYDGLPYRRRQELHARVAQVYEDRYGEDAAELLSLHFLRAGLHEQAWRYSLLAGRRAQEKWANVEAADFYRRALEAAESSAVDSLERAHVWESLADVLQLAGELEEAASALARARRLAPAGGAEQPLLMLKEGLLREEMARYSDALRWYGRGFTATQSLVDEAERDAIRLRLSMAYAQARFRQGDFEDCIRRCREIVPEAERVDDRRNLAHALYLLHVVYTLLGSPERVGLRRLALPIYEELGDLGGQASVLNNLGIEAYYEGRWDAALDLYERSREFRRRIGDVVNVALTTNNIGEILSDQGRLDEAAALFEEASRAAEAAGQRLIANGARSNLGRVAARAGRLDEAEQLLLSALDGLREIHGGPLLVDAEARLAELALFRGDRPQEALVLAADALEHAQAIGGIASIRALAHRVLGLARAQLRDSDTARAELDESLRIGREADAPYEVALTLAARAQLERAQLPTEARELLDRLGVASIPQPPLP